MSSLLDHLYNYCERTGSGLWDEPLNAVSNISFFIAACVLWRQYRVTPHLLRGPDPAIRRGDKILIFLIFLVGIGSTLFHTFANRLTLIGDVVPIALFTFTYLWMVLRQLLHMPKNKAIIALVAFAAAGVLMGQVPPALRFNGSVDYFPCLGALFIIVGYLYKRDRASASLMFRAACWFTASIVYRSLDVKLCPVIPIGTHFIWHIINGWVLYLLVRVLLKKRKQDY